MYATILMEYVYIRNKKSNTNNNNNKCVRLAKSKSVYMRLKQKSNGILNPAIQTEKWTGWCRKKKKQ